MPAFTELFKDWRPYFKVVGAQMFGQVHSVQAVPAVEDPHGGFTQVRIAALQALGEITAAHGEQAEQTVPALLAGLTDKEGVVRAAAVRGLAALANNAGVNRDEIVTHLQACTADKNPLVVAAATGGAADGVQSAGEVSNIGVRVQHKDTSHKVHKGKISFCVRVAVFWRSLCSGTAYRGS